jgi:prolyl-tRNA synthetase
MKDAYSFDRDMEGLNKSYDIMLNAYNNIFKRMELDTIVIAADSGAMGGSVSHEFMVTAPIGEDAVAVCDTCDFRAAADSVNDLKDGKNDVLCPKCQKGRLNRMPAIELGHIFQLGTKYSAALDALYLDVNGQRKPLIMGCYGIGVSRVMAAVIEVHHDDKGIIWPKEIAPFDVEIVPLSGGQADSEANVLTDRLYKELHGGGIEVLVDDREESPGRKFNDADLLGIPLRITLGRKALAEGKVEIKLRRTGETIFEPKDSAAAKVRSLLERI